MTAQEGHATAEQYYPVKAPSGKIHYPPEGRCWGIARATYEKLLSEGRIYFGKKGDAQPNIIRYLDEVEGMTPWTWWPSDEVGHTDAAKKEIHSLFGRKSAFGTPKPESLIERVIHISTNPGDLVLDSFLGSGTTAAVAHKMQRRYIGIEMGEHAVTHCVPRLKQVVDGEQGGISEARSWRGGGGFRFYRLGLPVFTEDGQIQPDIKYSVLAAHIWFTETSTSWTKPNDQTPFLGSHGGHGYALLYNGILGDKAASNGNVLTRKILAVIRDAQGGFEGPMTIYGERTMLSEATLNAEQIEFKQTPYDVKART